MATALAIVEQESIWGPIASVPDDRKDGRDMLLWAGYPAISSWCGEWCDAVGRPIRGVTHWADIDAPVS